MSFCECKCEECSQQPADAYDIEKIIENRLDERDRLRGYGDNTIALNGLQQSVVDLVVEVLKEREII